MGNDSRDGGFRKSMDRQPFSDNIAVALALQGLIYLKLLSTSRYRFHQHASPILLTSKPQLLDTDLSSCTTLVSQL
jgi:hypothetical protein